MRALLAVPKVSSEGGADSKHLEDSGRDSWNESNGK